MNKEYISKTEQCGEIAWYQNILVKFQLKILGCDDFYILQWGIQHGVCKIPWNAEWQI